MKKRAFSPVLGHIVGLSTLAALVVALFLEHQKAERTASILADFSTAAARAEPILTDSRISLLDFFGRMTDVYRNGPIEKFHLQAEEVEQQNERLAAFLAEKNVEKGALAERLAFFSDTVFRLADSEKQLREVALFPPADFLDEAEKGQIEPFLSVLQLKKAARSLAAITSLSGRVKCIDIIFDPFWPVLLEKRHGLRRVGQKTEGEWLLAGHQYFRKARGWADGEELPMERDFARFSKTINGSGQNSMVVRAEFLRWNRAALRLDTICCERFY